MYDYRQTISKFKFRYNSAMCSTEKAKDALSSEDVIIVLSFLLDKLLL